MQTPLSPAGGLAASLLGAAASAAASVAHSVQSALQRGRQLAAEQDSSLSEEAAGGGAIAAPGEAAGAGEDETAGGAAAAPGGAGEEAQGAVGSGRETAEEEAAGGGEAGAAAPEQPEVTPLGQHLRPLSEVHPALPSLASAEAQRLLAGQAAAHVHPGAPLHLPASDAWEGQPPPPPLRPPSGQGSAALPEAAGASEEAPPEAAGASEEEAQAPLPEGGEAAPAGGEAAGRPTAAGLAPVPQILEAGGEPLAAPQAAAVERGGPELRREAGEPLPANPFAHQQTMKVCVMSKVKGRGAEGGRLACACRALPSPARPASFERTPGCLTCPVIHVPACSSYSLR